MLKVGVAPLTIFGQPVPSTRAYRANVLAEFHQCNLTCTCRAVISAKAVTVTHTNTHRQGQQYGLLSNDNQQLSVHTTYWFTSQKVMLQKTTTLTCVDAD